MSEKSKKKPRRVVEKEVKETGVALDIPREIYEKFLDEIQRGEHKFCTPFMIAQRYGVKISVAKRMLKEASRRGLLVLYSPGRRVPIYIPKTGS